MEKNNWFLYILECNDGSYYTGITNNIELRMQAHKTGKGSKCVRAKGFKQLLKTKQCKDKSDASKQELKVKQLPRSEKLSYFN